MKKTKILFASLALCGFMGLAYAASDAVTSPDAPETPGAAGSEEKVGTITDEITAWTIGNPSSNWKYETHEGVKAVSDAEYTFQCGLPSQGYILFRATNMNSGFITSTQGGDVKEITVEFGNASYVPGVIDAAIPGDPEKAPKLTVLGSHTPYNAVTDLFYPTTMGDELGEITEEEPTFALDGSYEYIGVRVADAYTVAVSSIKVTLEGPQYYVEAPVFVDPENEATVYGESVILGTPSVITCEAEGATIWYSDNENGPFAVYTDEKFDPRREVTYYTYATTHNGECKSEVTTLEYTFKPIDNLVDAAAEPVGAPYKYTGELIVVARGNEASLVYDGNTFGLLSTNIPFAKGNYIAADWLAQTTADGSIMPYSSYAFGTFSWPQGDEAAAVASSNVKGLATTSVTVGSDLTVDVQKPIPAIGLNSSIMKYKPKTSNPGAVEADMIEYTVKVKDGYTFNPSYFEFDAVKYGTDNASMSWSYVIDGVESDIYTIAKENLIRNNGNNSWENGGQAQLKHVEGFAAAHPATEFAIRFYVSNFADNKDLCLGNIKIHGLVNAIDPYEIPSDAAITVDGYAENLPVATAYDNVVDCKVANNYCTLNNVVFAEGTPAIGGETVATVEDTEVTIKNMFDIYQYYLYQETEECTYNVTGVWVADGEDLVFAPVRYVPVTEEFDLSDVCGNYDFIDVVAFNPGDGAVDVDAMVNQTKQVAVRPSENANEVTITGLFPGLDVTLTGVVDLDRNLLSIDPADVEIDGVTYRFCGYTHQYDPLVFQISGEYLYRTNDVDMYLYNYDSRSWTGFIDLGFNLKKYVPEDLYLFGEMNAWGNNTEANKAWKFTSYDGVTYTLVVPAEIPADKMFIVADGVYDAATSPAVKSWGGVTGMDLNKNYEVYLQNPFYVSHCNLAETFPAGGTVTFVFNDKGDATITFDNTTAIEAIDAVAGDAVYYNINGVKVENPAQGGVYIRVIDGKATKVYVK